MASRSRADFAGKRAVITGGDRGIGFGIARELAAAGAEVCLVARDDEALAAARAEIEGFGRACHALSCDLASVAGAQRAAARLLELAPRWDILVNNAGNPPGPSLLDMDVAFWDTTFGVHCRAPFLLSQALVPGMIAGGGGNILNISSVAGLVGFRGHGAYSPAKAALNMLTRAMALEWGEHGIKVNAICPTVVLTKLGQEVWGSHPVQAAWAQAKIPAGRFAEVADVVRLALFLVSPDNSFLNGTLVPCDGGMVAGFADGPPAEAGRA
jgi:NAD(P)-dependent dehydrogenase (short-subunit alcohol dehydrogenase family)